MAAINDVFKAAKVNLTKKQNLVKKVKNELKKAEIAMKKAVSKFQNVENKLEAAKNELEAAKMQVQIIRRKGCFEEILWKFPHIGEQIIEKLGNKSLVKCKKVNVMWMNFIKEGKIALIRKIQHIQGPQGLSAHFNLAQTGRKKVAMSKLMVPIIANKGTSLKTWSVFMYLSNPGLSTLTKYRYTSHQYTMSYVYPFV